MLNIINGLRFDNIKGDVYGGLTAAVVALPLALAFGVASGAGPLAGLYGAIFVGLFAALFGGTPAQVSGPTGPMTVVMAAVITQYAHFPALAFTVVMMGGAIQIIFGLARLGRYIRLVPYPVVSGFMSGIGCIIIILEIAPLLGLQSPGGGVLSALNDLPYMVTHLNADALMIGVIALATVIFLPARINRFLPAPLVALILGSVLTLTVLESAPIIGSIPTGLPHPAMPVFEWPLLTDMLKSAMVLALLGSIDSLLTSLVADNITRSRHDSNRELIGQGIGNMVAGLFSGLPGAGATMRTVINVRTGGQTPISGALHALTLLMIVLGLGRYAAHIPHAVLAGILIKVGADIIDWDYLKRIRHAPRKGVVVMLVVLVLTVFVDLIMAVGVGVVLASLLFVKQYADLQEAELRAARNRRSNMTLSSDESALLDSLGDAVLLFRLRGPLSFGAAKDMVDHMLSDISCQVLILDLSEAQYIDSSAAFAIEEVVERAQALERDVMLVGMSSRIAKTLNRLGVLRLLGRDRRFYKRMSALKMAATIVAGQSNTLSSQQT